MQNTSEELHDRATRGGQLTEVEQKQLEVWYAELDRQEMKAIFGSELPPSLHEMEDANNLLRTQIDVLVADVAQSASQLKVLHDQNRALHAKIEVLLKRLAQQSVREVA